MVNCMSILQKAIAISLKLTLLKKTLNIPEEIPAELTSTTVELEIIGITDVKLDHCCVKCNRIVPTRSITKCENPKCKLVQKLEKMQKKIGM